MLSLGCDQRTRLQAPCIILIYCICVVPCTYYAGWGSLHGDVGGISNVLVNQQAESRLYNYANIVIYKPDIFHDPVQLATSQIWR